MKEHRNRRNIVEAEVVEDKASEQQFAETAKKAVSAALFCIKGITTLTADTIKYACDKAQEMLKK